MGDVIFFYFILLHYCRKRNVPTLIVFTEFINNSENRFSRKLLMKLDIFARLQQTKQRILGHYDTMDWQPVEVTNYDLLS